jgi:hypothetical protein
LRGHPASENVAIRICVLGHGDGLNHQFAFWSIGHVVPHNSITVDATIFLFLSLLTKLLKRMRPADEKRRSKLRKAYRFPLPASLELFMTERMMTTY